MRAVELTQILEGIFDNRIKDYGPNGLQVQGSDEVKKIVTGVTASLDLIEAAVDNDADTIIVHHGIFWKGTPQEIVGMQHGRIKKLLVNNINLYAYHLPLDVHPEFGNNALLAKAIGATKVVPAASVTPEGLMMVGNVSCSVDDLVQKLSLELNYQVRSYGAQKNQLSKVGWVTGAGQDFIHQAAAASCDAFISGEVSERTFHEAQELGVTYLQAGHHATERAGIKALGEHLATKHRLDVQFIDIPNPV